MIRSGKQYEQAKRDLLDNERAIESERRMYLQQGLTPDQIDRALGPTLLLHAQRQSEVEWYERALRRDFSRMHDLSEMGRMLIALRIANGLTQKELAERLHVSESQVSQDERNEYHGISVDKAQRILSALGERLLLTHR